MHSVQFKKTSVRLFPEGERLVNRGLTVINFGKHLRNRKHFRVLSTCRNTSGRLGEREMLWDQEPQASASTAFSSSPKLSGIQILNPLHRRCGPSARCYATRCHRIFNVSSVANQRTALVIERLWIYTKTKTR